MLPPLGRSRKNPQFMMFHSFVLPQLRSLPQDLGANLFPNYGLSKASLPEIRILHIEMNSQTLIFEELIVVYIGRV